MLGVFYDGRGELTQALEYHHKSLAISEAIGNQIEIARILNNIGCLYGYKGDFKSATDYFARSLKISRKIEHGKIVSDSLYQQIRFFVDILSPETLESYLEELRRLNKRY